MMDVSEIDDFVRRCEAAQADLKPYAGKALEEIGEQFLLMVQSSIKRAGNVDYGKLLASFEKGGADNVWNIDLGALTLEVGSTLDYAKYVNDGHKQQPGRFIPGYWEGSHFRYSPGAKSGMVLKASAVPGSAFFSQAVQALESRLPEMLKNSFEQFFRRYFS